MKTDDNGNQFLQIKYSCSPRTPASWKYSPNCCIFFFFFRRMLKHAFI